MIAVERQQQSLDDVGDVDEGQGVVAATDDDALASSQPVRHPAEVQAVTGTEERAGADDHSWQVIVGDHPLHGQVALGLRDRVGLAERPEQEVLPGGSARSIP